MCCTKIKNAEKKVYIQLFSTHRVLYVVGFNYIDVTRDVGDT